MEESRLLHGSESEEQLVQAAHAVRGWTVVVSIVLRENNADRMMSLLRPPRNLTVNDKFSFASGL